jgi:hypothetical protein
LLYKDAKNAAFLFVSLINMRPRLASFAIFDRRNRALARCVLSDAFCVELTIEAMSVKSYFI